MKPGLTSGFFELSIELVRLLKMASKNSVEPTISDSGELIYELIGSGGREEDVNHSLAFVELAEGKSTEPHFHEESEETYYVLGGRGEISVDGNEFQMVQGQACLIEPGEVHEVAGLEGGLRFLAMSVPAWTPDDSYSV